MLADRDHDHDTKQILEDIQWTLEKVGATNNDMHESDQKIERGPGAETGQETEEYREMVLDHMEIATTEAGHPKDKEKAMENEDTVDEMLARRTSRATVLYSHTNNILVSKMFQPEMF